MKKTIEEKTVYITMKRLRSNDKVSSWPWAVIPMELQELELGGKLS